MLIIFTVCISIALCFGVAWRQLGGRASAVAAVSWLLYPPYELWIQSTCVGDCNIRIDLLLIGTWMLTASIRGLVEIVRRWGSRSKSSRDSN